MYKFLVSFNCKSKLRKIALIDQGCQNVYETYCDIIQIYNTSVVMTRNEVASIYLRINLPVMCSYGGSGCGIELQVYDDSDDYSCLDSTIAVKVKQL